MFREGIEKRENQRQAAAAAAAAEAGKKKGMMSSFATKGKGVFGGKSSGGGAAAAGTASFGECWVAVCAPAALMSAWIEGDIGNIGLGSLLTHMLSCTTFLAEASSKAGPPSDAQYSDLAAMTARTVLCMSLQVPETAAYLRPIPLQVIAAHL